MATNTTLGITTLSPTVINAAQQGRTVADPNPKYQSLRPLWDRGRAILNGQRYVKDLDGIVDTYSFSNILLPFSPSMTQQQYQFYKAEAEFPGITSQYARTIVGGLLRKPPTLELPEDAPKDAWHWLMHQFTKDDQAMLHFLDEALWEEMQTSRAWVYVDHPSVPEDSDLTEEEKEAIKPYPVMWKAESVVNWKMGVNPRTKQSQLTRVIVRNFVPDYTLNEFHPLYLDTIWVHEIGEDGYYQIRWFQKPYQDQSIPVINGVVQQFYQVGAQATINNSGNGGFLEQQIITNITQNGKRLSFIPAWPLNGQVDIMEPMLTPLIDREIGLYNKISRRNHLLYGAATYTPVIMSDMTDDEFQQVVDSGLGSWIKIRRDDDIKALETPTAALQDMDRAITQTIEEMARMGIRLLSPENEQSGVALEIRNAAQTAQLGTLNAKISTTLSQVICLMINWRYNTNYTVHDIKFCLSTDFNPAPLGADYLRLVSEWYQAGIIPRTVFLDICKKNDIIAPDYDDGSGKEEIEQDGMIITDREDYDFQARVQGSQTGVKPPPAVKTKVTNPSPVGQNESSNSNYAPSGIRTNNLKNTGMGEQFTNPSGVTDVNGRQQI